MRSNLEVSCAAGVDEQSTQRCELEEELGVHLGTKGADFFEARRGKPATVLHSLSHAVVKIVDRSTPLLEYFGLQIEERCQAGSVVSADRELEIRTRNIRRQTTDTGPILRRNGNTRVNIEQSSISYLQR